MRNSGFEVDYILGYGSPKDQIPILAHDSNADLLVMGAHGHKGWKDLFFGTTISGVRHRVKIPILLVNNYEQ